MKILLALFCILLSQTALAVTHNENFAHNWNGPYLGIQIGGGLGDAHFSDPFAPSLFDTSVRSPLFLGGGQIGYNWWLPHRPWIFGIEGAASGLVSDGTATGNAFSGFYLSQNCRVRPKMITTLTGRVGTLIGPACENLIYVKAGPALIHNRVDLATNGIPPTPDVANTTSYSKFGVLIGGGLEYALTTAWSLGLEYNYLQFRDASIQVPTSAMVDFDTPEPSLLVLEGAKSNVAQHINLYKLSLNYKFGTNPCKDWNLLPVFNCKVHGWSFEGGLRYWFDEGRFQKDLGGGELPAEAGSLVSRLTYVTHSHANELFARLDSPWNLFLKGYTSLGSSHLDGTMNDEDWLADDLVYSNTTHIVRGKLNYFTVDGGYNLFHHCDRKLGCFVGYNYYHESNTALGCTQIANPFLEWHIPTSVSGITENVKWESLRLGLNSEMRLCPRLKLSSEVAFLPYTRFRGLDVHLQRTDISNQNSLEFGRGYGAQTEVILSYLLANKLSVGVGGRYLAMWTRKKAFTDIFGGWAHPTLLSKTERGGVFLQLSYEL